MFLEDWYHNHDLRPLLVLAVFLIMILVALVLVEADHRSRTRDGQRVLPGKGELLPRMPLPPELPADDRPVLTLLKDESDEQLFTKVEEYRRDFDGPYQAS